MMKGREFHMWTTPELKWRVVESGRNCACIAVLVGNGKTNTIITSKKFPPKPPFHYPRQGLGNLLFAIVVLQWKFEATSESKQQKYTTKSELTSWKLHASDF